MSLFQSYSVQIIDCGRRLWTMDWHNSQCALVIRKGRLRDLQAAGTSSEKHFRFLSLYETPWKGRHLRKGNIATTKWTRVMCCRIKQKIGKWGVLIIQGEDVESLALSRKFCGIPRKELVLSGGFSDPMKVWSSTEKRSGRSGFRPRRGGRTKVSYWQEMLTSESFSR